MKPTQDQIDDVLNQCAEFEETGISKFPSMSYEQGIRAALDWMEGRGSNPME